MSGECAISSVLSRCSKNLKLADQCYSSVTTQLLEAKDTTPSRQDGGPTPKDAKRRERLKFGSSLYIYIYILFFFSLLPLNLPYVNWASQEACFLFIYLFFSSELLLLVFEYSFVLFFQAFPFFVF